METQTKTVPSSLMWVAGVAIILFSAAGIGAIMGWIPTSMGQSGSSSVASPSVAEKAPVPVQRQVTEQRHSNVQAAVRCSQCGVIESTREIVSKGEGGAMGVVGGAVVGGLLGNQVGGGRGKDLATIAGAIGGGYAGNEIEKRNNSTKSYEVTIRMDDGSSRAFNAGSASSWRSGDHVKIVDGAIRSN